MTVHQSALPAIWAAFMEALNVPEVTAIGPVYDHIPPDPPYPHVRLSSPTENRQDTFGTAGKDVTVQVHIFSSSETYEGAGEAQSLLSAVIGALHYRLLTIVGHDLLSVQYENGIDAGDDDVNGTVIKHYVASFRVQVMENTAQPPAPWMQQGWTQ